MSSRAEIVIRGTRAGLCKKRVFHVFHVFHHARNLEELRFFGDAEWNTLENARCSTCSISGSVKREKYWFLAIFCNRG